MQSLRRMTMQDKRKELSPWEASRESDCSVVILGNYAASVIATDTDDNAVILQHRDSLERQALKDRFLG